MSTARLAVRNALVSVIGTATGLTVYRNLDYALEERLLPAVAVTSDDDGRATELDTLDEQGRQARFFVHVLVAASADPEADADVIEDQFMAAVRADWTLGGAAIYGEYLGGEWNFDLGDCAIRRLALEFNFYS